MSRNIVLVPVMSVALIALLACVTINVYFPEAEINDLIEKIEDEVEKPVAKEETAVPEEGQDVNTSGTEEKSGAPSQSLLEQLLGVTPVYAQGPPEPEISSPAIRRIIQSRQGRIEELDHFKRIGAIGENNQGLLEIRDLEAVDDLRARAAVQRLVRAENADREQLFREIAIAKGVDPSQIPRIRENYAEQLRARARPGDWIQMPDGNWRRK